LSADLDLGPLVRIFRLMMQAGLDGRVDVLQPGETSEEKTLPKLAISSFACLLAVVRAVLDLVVGNKRNSYDHI
jgi:hypothetical protein